MKRAQSSNSTSCNLLYTEEAKESKAHTVFFEDSVQGGVCIQGINESKTPPNQLSPTQLDMEKDITCTIQTYLDTVTKEDSPAILFDWQDRYPRYPKSQSALVVLPQSRDMFAFQRACFLLEEKFAPSIVQIDGMTFLEWRLRSHPIYIYVPRRNDQFMVDDDCINQAFLRTKPRHILVFGSAGAGGFESVDIGYTNACGKIGKPVYGKTIFCWDQNMKELPEVSQIQPNRLPSCFTRQQSMLSQYLPSAFRSHSVQWKERCLARTRSLKEKYHTICEEQGVDLKMLETQFEPPHYPPESTIADGRFPVRKQELRALLRSRVDTIFAIADDGMGRTIESARAQGIGVDVFRAIEHSSDEHSEKLFQIFGNELYEHAMMNLFDYALIILRALPFPS